MFPSATQVELTSDRLAESIDKARQKTALINSSRHTTVRERATEGGYPPVGEAGCGSSGVNLRQNRACMTARFLPPATSADAESCVAPPPHDETTQMTLEPEFLAAAAGRGKGRGKGRGTGGRGSVSPPGKAKAEERVRATVDGLYKGESVVGAIVGHKGTFIAEMQRISGALIRVDPERNVVVIEGTTKQARSMGCWPRLHPRACVLDVSRFTLRIVMQSPWSRPFACAPRAAGGGGEAARAREGAGSSLPD